jgi:sensor histidine kinase YesM
MYPWAKNAALLFTLVSGYHLMTRFTKHFIFWLVILFFQVTRSLPGNFNASAEDIFIVLLEHLSMLPILMAASYLTADWIFPVFFYRKKYVSFGFLLAGSAVIFIFLMRSFLYFLYLPVFYPGTAAKNPDFMDFNIFQHIFYIYSTVAIVLMIKYLNYANRLEQERLSLEKQNLASEQALLRSQISPHFLFNTLNNINSLIGKDPEKSRVSVVKLSEIMRYMLREVKDEIVPLAVEIEYLQNYIGLLALRVSTPEFIRFTVKGDPGSISVAPMMFIPFIENAFKHGSKKVPSPGIEATLEITPGRINYEVVNYVCTAGEERTSDPTSGIGIPNLRRRMDLLYPGRHLLSEGVEGNRYLARLSFTY